MKESKTLKEVHEIMEGIYEEEKGLRVSLRVKRIREESEEFMKSRGLNLKRISHKELVGFKTALS